MLHRTWPWMVVGFVLLSYPALYAIPTGYEPFSKSQTPKPMPLKACPRFGVPGTANTTFYYRLPNSVSTIRTDQSEQDYGSTVIALLDAKRRPLLQRPAINSMFSGIQDVYAADLNGDGTSDYIVVIWSGGVGLAGCHFGVTFLLSEGKSYVAIPADTFEFHPKDVFCIGKGRTPHFVRAQFVNLNETQTRDGKMHSFWVYRLYRFEKGRMVEANGDLPGFPKLVQYTFRDNHSETNLLSGEVKQKLIKELDRPE
jgi:hypothetical protein